MLSSTQAVEVLAEFNINDEYATEATTTVIIHTRRWDGTSEMVVDGWKARKQLNGLGSQELEKFQWDFLDDLPQK